MNAKTNKLAILAYIIRIAVLVTLAINYNLGLAIALFVLGEADRLITKQIVIRSLKDE